jgi:hypothetical protein
VKCENQIRQPTLPDYFLQRKSRDRSRGGIFLGID